MSGFTASNGLSVEVEEESVHITRPDRPTSPIWLRSDEQTALREYFQQEHPDLVAARARWQHQEDARLGRWRWPENPDYVVYPDSGGRGQGINVLRESSAYVEFFYPADDLDGRRGEFTSAARAYFDAHPEPKPWDSAEDGEIWVLTGAGGLKQPWRRIAGKWIAFTRGEQPYDAVAATDGHRIWPEVTS